MHLIIVALRTSALFAWFAIWFTTSANGFEVSPLVHELAASGKEANSTIVIRNTADVPTPVEVTITELIFGADGNIEKEEPAEDFVIFPPTALIPVGASQAVRIQWIGTPEIDTSRSFFANINQVPVEIDGNGAGVQVLFAFKVLVHVIPDESRAELDVVSTELQRLEGGELTLLTKITNNGDRYGYTSDNAIDIRSKGSDLLLNPDDIRRENLDRLVAPGVTREIVVPLGSGDWSEPISIEILSN